jgi:hypothetical protein
MGRRVVEAAGEGRCGVVRYADDLVLGFERCDDAEQVPLTV